MNFKVLMCRVLRASGMMLHSCSVHLSCKGDMTGVSTATNNPSPFLPTYPNEITVPSVPGTINQQQTGGFKYAFNITQTG